VALPDNNENNSAARAGIKGNNKDWNRGGLYETKKTPLIDRKANLYLCRYSS
jgi:hypothetical protein